ncbi:MAG: beta-phosphoglucomutase [Bacteroidota bacterium]
MIKGFLFDLDGVIVDTAKYHFLAWKRLADELNIPFTLHDNERLKGVSRMASLEIILEIGNKNLTEEEKLRFATRKNEWYVDYITKMDPEEVLPGALSFLRESKKNNIKIALGSASKNAITILDRLGISNYFDALITGNEVSNAKPDPEVFLKGAEALSLTPEECIVFEDAKAGIEAARNGGMLCIGIGSNDILGEADLVVDGLHDLTVDQALKLNDKYKSNR